MKLASSISARLETRLDEMVKPEIVDKIVDEIAKRIAILDERRLASSALRRLFSESPDFRSRKRGSVELQPVSREIDS